MNSLENNAAEAIRDYLETDAELAAIPPVVWDDTTEPGMPCLVIKATQGEELVYRHGVYRITVDILAEGLAAEDVVDNIKARVTRMLLDNMAAHTFLTTTHFHCFASESGTVSLSNSGPKRIMSVRLSLVGFDLDRHVPVVPPIPIPEANLILWLKPDELTGADGSAVISCPDSSGLNRHAVKLGASNPVLKLNVLNGKKVLQFSGAASERLGGQTNLVTPNLTAFIVWKMDSDSATYARGLSVTKNNATGDTTGSTNRVLAMRYFGAQQAMNYATGSEIAFAPFPSYANHFLMTSRFDGVRGYVSINSNAEVAGTSYPWTLDAQVYAIGGDPSGTTGLKGQIAEVIMYDASLDPTKLAEVKDYLKTRFALP